MASAREQSDVAIRERIIALLEARGPMLSVETLGREVFCFRTVPVAFVRQMLRRLFADDPRLVLRDDDRVELRPASSADAPHAWGDGSEISENPSLEEAEYVVLDVETTGLRPTADRVIEVAAFRVATSGGRARILEEFVTLVNPERPIPPTIVRLTGITPPMVARAPRFPEIADPLMAFIGSRVLVAHNARFDLGFLEAELQRARARRLSHPHLCTLALSRRLFPELPNHRLPTLAHYLGIEMETWHRARSDAWATARLFLRLLNPLLERGVCTLSEAMRFQAARRDANRSRR
jgi:DNA polymerase III epsilon subunit family exonuclease